MKYGKEEQIFEIGSYVKITDVVMGFTTNVGEGVITEYLTPYYSVTNGFDIWRCKAILIELISKPIKDASK